MDPAIRDAVQTEFTFRAANEGIRQATVAHAIEGRIPFICECADVRCTRLVQLTMDEYGRIREEPAWFVAPGHEEERLAEVIRVVCREPGHSVIETVGEAANILGQLG